MYIHMCESYIYLYIYMYIHANLYKCTHICIYIYINRRKPKPSPPRGIFFFLAYLDLKKRNEEDPAWKTPTLVGGGFNVGGPLKNDPKFNFPKNWESFSGDWSLKKKRQQRGGIWAKNINVYINIYTQDCPIYAKVHGWFVVSLSLYICIQMYICVP